MADNVAITAGSGTDIATDQVTGTGEHVQLVKLSYSADGSRTPASVDADGVLVNLGANNDVTVTGTVTVDLGTNNDVTVTGTVAVDLGANNDVTATGNVAHDAADSGAPVKVGHKAIAHGANPTAVAADDRTDWYANRHGVPFVLGGHPNIITRSVRIADADGAQTDASMVGTINTGTKVAVTALAVACDAGNTNALACKVGFGGTSIPADSTTGANGVLLDHEGIAPGSGMVIGNGAGLLGIGADGEELRLTCEDPVGGFITVTFSYFTIES